MAKYNISYDQRLRKLLDLSATKKRIISELRIDMSTFDSWIDFKNPYYKPSFADIWRQHNKKMVKKVEDALLRSALGYHETVKKEVLDKWGRKVVLAEEKYHSPNIAAIKFVLINRSGGEWKPDHIMETAEETKIGQNIEINFVPKKDVQVEDVTIEDVQVEDVTIEDVQVEDVTIEDKKTK